MSTSKMNLISFKNDRKVTQNNHNQISDLRPPCQENNYNPLTVKDFLSAKASSTGRAEARERGERAWLGTAKKI